MSETKWTPAQRAAIDDRGGALLVSAAAGSGKTAVLTERAVRLITDPEHPVDADRLLIVTFTNAAAAELRARIGQALLRRSQAEPSNTALRRQRMLLQRAPICTIDAFCLDLLRKHFQALDIPPDFTPADPGSVETLRTAALAETLEAAYLNADFCAFADLYGKGRTDSAAGEAVLQVYDFLRALPDYGRKLDEMLAPWQDENGFVRTCWHDILLAEAARSARAAGELLSAALKDSRADLVTARADAEASKKTPAAKEKAVAGMNERFAEPLERLESAAALLGEVEHLALRLLRDEDGQPTELCQSIRQGYAAVMVDEYQDTNALQDALYRCLASPAGDDLFLVGDLKQSIYRFRQADPTIFREKLESWPPLPGGAARPRPEEGASGRNALLALDANFRSAPQVVAGINFLFEQLMTPRLGDTAYGDGQRLVCGAPGEYEGSVEACFLSDDTAETDANYIADRIETMVSSGEPVRDGGTTRPVQYEDCCVLLAARGDFPAYAEALTARGIPVYADARENLLDAPHIRPLIALLRVIDNPAQDIYLAAAMLGPMFGFTDDDLVRLRAGAQSTDQHTRISLYGAVLQAARSGAEDDFTRRVGAFYQRLAALRRMARSVPVEELLEEIFVSTGYLAALGAMENGQRRREDARRFAAFCAGAGAGGISALVRAIDAAALAGSTGQETTPGGARPGCVTIMTIHRSKGLQFPVVFVADTARQFNAADTRQPVLLHRVCGAGLRLRPEGGEGSYRTAAYTALATVHAAELRSEQMRLLYVALTRAQDKLILTVPLGIGRTSNPFAKAAAFLAAGAGQTLNAQAGSFADWLRAALLVHPNGGPLRRLAGNLELPFVDTGSALTLTVQADPLPPAGPRTEENAPPQPEADPALVETLRQGFGWQYPAAVLANIPAKVSVTSLVHAAERTTLERPGFLSKDGLTAAEMGTALHAFLEHADFAALAAVRGGEDAAVLDAVRTERERQVAAQLTPPAIAEKLDENKILRFVRSEAFDRICGAEEVLRELAFITSLPAAEVMAAQGRALPEGDGAADAGVLVQGIADIVLVYPDHLELLDYKTDRRKTRADFVRAYRAQLELYAKAIDKRFAPRRVTYKGIYSLELGELIEV